MVIKSKKSLKSKVISKSAKTTTKRKMVTQTLGKTILKGAVTLTFIYGAYALYKKLVKGQGSDPSSSPVIQMSPMPGSFNTKQNLQ